MGSEIITVNATNVDRTGFFCYMSKRKTAGYQKKLTWLKQRFGEGLRIKMLRLPERGFIEYIPGEFAWRPVQAKGYMVIHCLWVVGRSRGKGNAARLLDACVVDARASGKKGVAMVTSGGRFMNWKCFLENEGFQAVGPTPLGYELMALRFGNDLWPKFTGGWEKRALAQGKGLTVLRTDQCPYYEDAAKALLDTARKTGLQAKLIELRTATDVRRLAPSPYGAFNVVLDGKLIPSHYQAREALMMQKRKKLV